MAIPTVAPDVFNDLARAIIENGARRATKYLSEKQVVKATAVLYGDKFDRRDKSLSILFTVGTPNFKEREFIKKAKLVGEPFPIKRIQLRFPKVR